MKRVICLYRVSTIGQVDHDDIPMQKLACREYAATHPDWEIVDEISEKGVSGYKVSTNARDAIVEIKKRATRHQFDVLLVFMFDRLGRRDDETPFVVQWFVQQGIEVWSTREGEQRFDNHVDKLLNYIRFWQASGESEKTSIRVRTKHSQMVQEGQWRGGYLAFGYRLEYLGRTNKKNQPVRDLVIDEAEAAVVREIYHLLTEEGYGTNRVAQYLNDRGIKTKKGKPNWRGTTIRSMVENPIYMGVLTFGDERSEPFENLRIIDDAQFERCNEIVKGRSPKYYQQETIVPIRTDSRSLLTGILFCADCGSRMCYSHNVIKRTLADGTPRVYERNLYRCYRKVSSKKACSGQSAYDMEPINAAVEKEVKKFLKRLASKPREALVEAASARNEKSYQAALEQAEKEYVIFVDPDNGIVVPSALGTVKENKFVKPDELVDYYKQGSSVIYYQHKARRSDSFYVDQHKRLIEMLGLEKSAGLGLKFTKTSQRYYFFIIQSAHKETIMGAIRKIQTSGWDSCFELC